MPAIGMMAMFTPGPGELPARIGPARSQPMGAPAVPPAGMMASRDHPGWVRCPGPPDMTISAMGNPGPRQAFTKVPDELGTAHTHITAPIRR
jgi:hypothetical protein